MADSRFSRIAAALAVALVLAGPANAQLRAGRESAPDFTLDDLRGDPVTLSDVLADGPVILDFWATWCRPCRKALPRLQKLATQYEGRVRVLTVSIDDPRSRTKIAPTVRSLGLTMPVLLDGDKTVASLFRVTSIPMTFLIASDGRIAAVHNGYRDGEMNKLESELNRLLAEGTAP